MVLCFSSQRVMFPTISSAYPAFLLIETAELWKVCAAQGIFGFALAIYGGNMPAYLVYKVHIKLHCRKI